ncbi:MAG: hypothetical protein J2P36_26110 [Ktedonobacteraceae bacterium]|nr:hypothetical protein [Ktedonobacteraceae bacterium]
MKFDDFEEALKPENWTYEQWLHAPTFKAQLKADGTLFLSGAALREGFSAEAAQALTRFLSERVQLLPKEPPYNFEDFKPQRVDESNEEIEPKD